MVAEFKWSPIGAIEPTSWYAPRYEILLCEKSFMFADRFATDFYITDSKSGIRAMVKAGYNSKLTPLIRETQLVKTAARNRALSSYLRKWLEEKNLSTEGRLLCLEEGWISMEAFCVNFSSYIKEGSYVTVMGVLQRDHSDVMIVQIPEPISTGCLWRRFLFPGDIGGLILKLCDSRGPAVGPLIAEGPGRQP
ncbi:hypothetical protein ACLOJK_004919 [Asimina triloba]